MKWYVLLSRKDVEEIGALASEKLLRRQGIRFPFELMECANKRIFS
jgi:hypothetical protein